MDATQPTHKGRHRRPLTGQVTQQLIQDTPAASISTISVNVIPPAMVHAADLTKNKSTGSSPNLILVHSHGLGRQAACESTNTRNSGGPTKGNQSSTSQHGVLTALPCGSHSGGGGGAGKDGQDPPGPGQPASHLATIVSSKDDFKDDLTRLFQLTMTILFHMSNTNTGIIKSMPFQPQ